MGPPDWHQHQRLAMVELTDDTALRAAMDLRATSAGAHPATSPTSPGLSALIPSCSLREQLDAQQFRLLTLRAEHQALQNNKAYLEACIVALKEEDDRRSSALDGMSYVSQHTTTSTAVPCNTNMAQALQYSARTFRSTACACVRGRRRLQPRPSFAWGIHGWR